MNEKVKVCNVMKTLYTLHFLHIVDIKKKWKCCTHFILLKSTICCNSFIKWILKKVKVLYTFHIIKIHHMLQFLHIVDIKKSESVVHISYYENPPYAAFSSYVDYSSFETIIISKILLHTLLSGPSLAGRPFEDQPSYHIMMKNHHMLESHHVIESHINLQ